MKTLAAIKALLNRRPNTLEAVQAFLNNRLALNRRPDTLTWYQCNLNKFASFFPKLPTKPEPIEEFLATVVSNRQDERKHGYYRTLKAFYRFICKRHRILNPMDLIDAPTRRKKVRPTLTSQEMMLLSQKPQKLRDKAIINLIIDTASRSAEEAFLRKQNIFDDYIKVDGKTGQRDIPISEETRRLLFALVACNGSSEYVFLGQRGPITPSGIYQVVRKYMRQCNISGPKLGPHRIRHAFGKHYIKNGGDTRSLQKIMGHANISTTELYVDLANEDIIDKHHQFTPLRSAHAAAQLSFDKLKAVKEAEAILAKKGGEQSK